MVLSITRVINIRARWYIRWSLESDRLLIMRKYLHQVDRGVVEIEIFISPLNRVNSLSYDYMNHYYWLYCFN